MGSKSEPTAWKYHLILVNHAMLSFFKEKLALNVNQDVGNITEYTHIDTATEVCMKKNANFTSHFLL